MVLCEMVLCEMVLCEMEFAKWLSVFAKQRNLICKLAANYKATLVSNRNGFFFASRRSIFTLRRPRLVNTKGNLRFLVVVNFDLYKFWYLNLWNGHMFQSPLSTDPKLPWPILSLSLNSVHWKLGIPSKYSFAKDKQLICGILKAIITYKEAKLQFHLQLTKNVWPKNRALEVI